MTSWSARYRLAEGVRESLWVAPLAGGAVGAALGAGVAGLNVSLPWTYSEATASAVIAAVAAAEIVMACIAVIVFRGSSDGAVKALLALILGTIGFSFAVLSDVEDLGVTIAIGLVVAGLVSFLAAVGRVSANLRPVAVASV